MMRKTALWKDVWRAIRGNGKRFAAIVVIVAVGAMMLGGLNTVGKDIRAGLDDFFNETNMHDVSIVSTRGFGGGDIAALRNVDGVADAAGGSPAVFDDGEYTIVGVVIDPNDIVNPTGPLALVMGAKTMNTYDDYLATVDDAKDAIGLSCGRGLLGFLVSRLDPPLERIDMVGALKSPE